MPRKPAEKPWMISMSHPKSRVICPMCGMHAWQSQLNRDHGMEIAIHARGTGPGAGRGWIRMHDAKIDVKILYKTAQALAAKMIRWIERFAPTVLEKYVEENAPTPDVVTPTIIEAPTMHAPTTYATSHGQMAHSAPPMYDYPSPSTYAADVEPDDHPEIESDSSYDLHSNSSYET